MALYRFEAKSTEGKSIIGEMMGESEREVARRLQARGMFVLKVKEQQAAGPAAERGKFPGIWRGILEPVLLPVSSKARSLFFSSMASMMASGMSLRETMEDLGQRAMGRSLRAAGQDMAAAAMEGKRISSVCSDYPAAFPEFSKAMLEAGESAGMMEKAARLLGDYFQRASEIEMTFRFETFYVKLVILAGVLIPTVPTLVLGTSQAWFDQVLARTLPLLLLIVTLWYGCRLLLQNRLIRRIVDRVKLLTPGIGSIVRRNAVSKWCRAMAMLFEAGVPLQVAIEAAGSASGNTALAARINSLSHLVSEGQPLSQVMIRSGDFPNMVINMMVTGERSGSVEEALSKVAEYFEAETMTATKQMAVLLGVVAYLVVAVFIGLEIVSMYQTSYVGQFQGLTEMDPK